MVIDVLGFPPTAAALAELREIDLSPAARLLQLGYWARFVTLGMFLGWVADVAAALAPGSGPAAVWFGVGSVLLAVSVVGAHLLATRALTGAAQLSQRTDRAFAAIGFSEGRMLLERAGSDAVVAQYLRMVGRQQRPLYRIELAALSEWLKTQELLLAARAGVQASPRSASEPARAIPLAVSRQ